jgi:curved DNA-binding protein CbpA
LQGDLTRDALADVIRALYVNRRSGILHLAQGKVSKRIYFRKGSMIFANSDVETDRLGEFLIRRAVITREDFEKASRVMKETGNRFGRTLVELGHATPDEMEARVVEQIQTIIYSVFDWDSGEYRFEQHENPVDEDIVLNLSTADIILEGARRLDDLSKIRRVVGDPVRVLRTTEDPLLLYQKMSTLSQSEGFILSRVDGLSSVADILAISPIGEDETLRCIYGLVSAGVLEFEGGSAPRDEAPEPAGHGAFGKATDDTAMRSSVPPPRPAPPPATKPAPKVDIPRPDVEVRRPEPKASKPKPVEAKVESMGPSPEEIAVREDIIEKHASLRDATLYDLLGITITANEGEVKKAYYAMAKKYHPDRHHSPHLRDVHGLLEELFGKITDAYQVLSSPLEKNRYDSKIRAEGPAAVAGGSGTSADEASESARKRAADERYKEGKRHFDEMHFFDAIQCLREAVRLYPKKNYHKLLGQALMKNPKWLREAEEQFRFALKMDQFDAECYVGLGEIYESEGMSTRAQKMFEQAATYDPENESVHKKIGDKRSQGMGTLKKLFGRKKE